MKKLGVAGDMHSLGARTTHVAGELLNLLGGGQTLILQAKRTLYAEDDPADAVFYVEKGMIKVTARSAAGKEIVVGIVGAGEFLGQSCLVGRERRRFKATTVGAATIVRIERDKILDVFRRDPAVRRRLVLYLVRRNLRVQEAFTDQLFNSSRQRLARALLLLADFHADETAHTISPKISQATLAEMIGTTRSRVSAFMNEFRRAGYVDYNGHLTVHRTLLNVIESR
jgi:CRP/FNR family cyclic AMP-dependent transcriptional regulator